MRCTGNQLFQLQSFFINNLVIAVLYFIFSEDIEVVNGDDHPDNPPTYDDLMESDRGSVKDSATSGEKSSKISTKLQHLNNPLKSIMRKGTEKLEKSEKSGSKVHRKESDSSSRRSRHERNDSTSDTNSPKSPKSTSFMGNSPSFQLNNSLSSSAGTSLFSNGDIADPTSVQVHIHDGASGKRTVVDQLDMASVSSQASSTYDKQHDHHHTSELLNGGREPIHANNIEVKVNPYLEDLAEDVNAEGSDIESEQEFMNTQL